MYNDEEYKLGGEEEHKFGFEENDISKEIEQVFHVSDYSVEGSIRYINKLAVKNNKFWIYTNDNKLYRMKLGGVPDLIDTNKLKKSTVLFIKPDEKGTHCVIGTKSQKGKYELFYLAETEKISLLTSFKSAEEISCCTVFVPEEENPEERSFEILIGTNLSSIYHGRFYVEKKGNITTEKSISEIYEINPKRKIYDICVFRTENERGILAISDSSLHQFWGELSLPLVDIFALSKMNISKIQKAVIQDTLNEKKNLNRSRDIRKRFQPSLSIHENMEEIIQSVGWQADSCFY